MLHSSHTQVTNVILHIHYCKHYTANSIKVDIDNSQMCNMIDRVPHER